MENYYTNVTREENRAHLEEPLKMILDFLCNCLHAFNLLTCNVKQ